MATGGMVIPGYYGGGGGYPKPPSPVYGSPTGAPYQQQAPQPGQNYSGYSNPVNPSGGYYTPPQQQPSYNPIYDIQAQQQAKIVADNAANDAAVAAAQEKADRDKLLSLITSSMNSSGGSSPTVQHPSTQQASQAARTAAFSRAKDQAGQIARASLTAIAEEMAGRGISGSGIEALRQAATIDDTSGALLNVTRDQAISDAARQAEIDDQIYQGGIAMRGQDLSNRQSYLALLKSIFNY